MARVEDLSGQSFGSLKVLKRDEARKERAYWICECICGKIISVSGTKLRNGQQSCGCLNSRQIQRLQRFGRLVALEPTEARSKNGNIIWKCQCDCGNIAYIRKDQLLNGITKSCGCLKREVSLQNLAQPIEDLTNQKFGMLTVKSLNLQKTQEGKRPYWNCECDCGGKIAVRADHLKSLSTVSCGCCKASSGEILIELCLKQASIKYEKEYSFKDLKYKKPLRFDFALFDKEDELVCLIEVDGMQHFVETNYFFPDTLQERQYKDKLKNEYCKNKNIPLFRIPYNSLKKVKTVKDIFISQFLYKGE